MRRWQTELERLSMQNKLSAILNRIGIANRPLRILTLPTHEGYQSLLDKTGHTFYMLTGANIKGWDHHTRKLPPNHILLPCDMQTGNCLMPPSFDLVLCQNRQYFEMMNRIAMDFGVPIITLDHTEPPPGLKPSQLEGWRNARAATAVYITEHNKISCNGKETDVVIPHGIDTDVFAGYTGTNKEVISVVNHYKAREVFCGYSIWEKVTKLGVPTKVIGENPGWTKSINNPVELAQTLGNARVYLNTSLYSPVPLSMLEAMSVGLPVVTTAKQEIPKIIQHGVNGYLSNDPVELAEYCTELLNNPEHARKIGENARQTVLDKFSLTQFTQNWNKVLYKTVEEYR